MFLSLLKFQQNLCLSTVWENFCWLGGVETDQINGDGFSSLNGKKKIDLAVQVGLVTRE